MCLNKKVAFVTLGCKVNQYETESIKKQFTDNGYTEAEFDEYADVYVVNSCTVTNIADRKTRNMIRRTKKINPASAVVVTGCYAQTNAEEIEMIEEVDLVVGNNEKGEVYRLAEKFISEGIKERRVSNIFDDNYYKELGFSTLREMSRAYIKIQDGCDNFCSYCKIPFARGHKRSRDINNIKEEVRHLAGEGYKEIILIGINLGAYGEDKGSEILIEDVIEEVSRQEEIERIRIGSIYPDRITERFIELMKRNKKMMPHLHISLQSGDTEILKLMKRKYTGEEALAKIKKLKQEIPLISITGDIITGFPGEREENHKNSLKVIEEGKFSDLHIFQYSDREKTLASTYKDKVSSKVKKERADELEAAKKKAGDEFRREMLGKSFKVLVEECDGEHSYGYTENYMRTEIKNYAGKINEIVSVKIKGLEGELLSGEKEDKN